MHPDRVIADQAATDRVLNSVTDKARLPAELSPEEAISAVMCTLTERLTTGEALDLLDAVPRTMRPLFQLCVRHREGLPPMQFDRPGFVEQVAEHIGVTPAHAELVCEVVFEAVRQELPDDLVAHVAQQLPRGIKHLWWSEPPRELATEATLSDDEARRGVEEYIERTVSLPSGVTSADAFAAVMCAFSERLSGGEARELLLGLPGTLRSLVRQCMLHRSEPAALFGQDELLLRVGSHLGVDPAVALPIVRATLTAVKRLLPEKAVFDVGSQLPRDLRELWDEA